MWIKAEPQYLELTESLPVSKSWCEAEPELAATSVCPQMYCHGSLLVNIFSVLEVIR